MLSFPDMRKVRALKGHTAVVLSVAQDRQQRWLATGGNDAVACLWDMQVGGRCRRNAETAGWLDGWECRAKHEGAPLCMPKAAYPPYSSLQAQSESGRVDQ